MEMKQTNEDEPMVLEEDDIQFKQEDSTDPNSKSSNNNTLNLPQQLTQGINQSMIYNSNNPLKSCNTSALNLNMNSKLDSQSRGSAYFVNEEELADYEEKMQLKV
jgi:hypothetical protein